MSTYEIEVWIKSIGDIYKNLVAMNVIPNQPLIDLYPGRDCSSLEPLVGVELSFWSESQKLETVFVTLIKSTPSTVVYTGELPPPYTPQMSQTDVHRIFGEPLEFKGPIKMPEPMGQTGGWESYLLDAAIFGPTKVVFQYTADMRVKTLVFTLIDKGHD